MRLTQHELALKIVSALKSRGFDAHAPTFCAAKDGSTASVFVTMDWRTDAHRMNLRLNLTWGRLGWSGIHGRGNRSVVLDIARAVITENTTA